MVLIFRFWSVQGEKREQSVSSQMGADLDLGPYLKQTGVLELQFVRKLSSLCARTYFLDKVTVCSYANPAVHAPPPSLPPLLFPRWLGATFWVSCRTCRLV